MLRGHDDHGMSVTYLARLELHGRAEANCPEQGTVSLIVYWVKAVAGPISDGVLQVFLIFLIFLFLTCPCVNSNMGRLRRVITLADVPGQRLCEVCAVM